MASKFIAALSAGGVGVAVVANKVVLAEANRKRGIYDPPGLEKKSLTSNDEESFFDPGLKVIDEFVSDRMQDIKGGVNAVKKQLNIEDVNFKLPDFNAVKIDVQESFTNPMTMDRTALMIKSAPIVFGLSTLLLKRNSPSWKKYLWVTGVTGTASMACYPSFRHSVLDSLFESADKVSDGKMTEATAKYDQVVAKVRDVDFPKPPKASDVRDKFKSIPDVIKSLPDTVRAQIEGRKQQPQEPVETNTQTPSANAEEPTKQEEHTHKDDDQEEDQVQTEQPTTEEDFGQSNSADRTTYSSRRQDKN